MRVGVQYENRINTIIVPIVTVNVSNMMHPEKIEPVSIDAYPRLEKAFRQAVPEPAPVLRLYRQVAKNERLFCTLVEGGVLGPRGLLWLEQMSSDERELIVLRTTARLDAGYEWSVHVAYFGRHSGLSPEQIAATATERIDHALWSARQVLVLRLVDSVLVAGTIDAALWADLVAEIDAAEIIEMISLVGMYRTVSCLANTLGTQDEQGVPAFPGWVPA